MTTDAVAIVLVHGVFDYLWRPDALINNLNEDNYYVVDCLNLLSGVGVAIKGLSIDNTNEVNYAGNPKFRSRETSIREAAHILGKYGPQVYYGRPNVKSTIINYDSCVKTGSEDPAQRY